MPGAVHSYTYTFSIYHIPTLDELIAELSKARETMGGEAKTRFVVTNDQRDGYSVTTTVEK